MPTTGLNTTPPHTNSFTFPPSCDLKPAFYGYSINHLSLVTPNLTRALTFYTQALGLQHIFTYNPIPKYHVAYLGHDTANFTSCAEFAQRKNEVKGLIELIHLEGATNHPLPAMKKPNTYSHFGLVVPDVKEAEGRIAAWGGRVIKGAGEETDVTNNELANAYGLGVEAIGSLEEGELEAIVEAFRDVRTGVMQSAFVGDPDGNLIELQPPVFE
ncbi:uncharacterized protein N0V89_005150 [Didymosphaeria variabile]|uniref:VOC domain-containing protein n=1 Tax=Didymosphaeria variabile TaxID=1932322 RepID=A0A9W9CA72_9PLEO|nr:uncharacterized protein N0V89_005150 [Didymosphaeria variabile]KAJ4353421.1 hypothetical protein N0V89_005150 [Didymosphaeria variabile]